MLWKDKPLEKATWMQKRTLDNYSNAAELLQAYESTLIPSEFYDEVRLLLFCYRCLLCRWRACLARSSSSRLGRWWACLARSSSSQLGRWRACRTLATYNLAPAPTACCAGTAGGVCYAATGGCRRDARRPGDPARGGCTQLQCRSGQYSCAARSCHAMPHTSLSCRWFLTCLPCSGPQHTSLATSTGAAACAEHILQAPRWPRGPPHHCWLVLAAVPLQLPCSTL